MGLKITDIQIHTGSIVETKEVTVNNYLNNLNLIPGTDEYEKTKEQSLKLMDSLGKNTRYVGNENESSVVLGALAAEKLMKENNIDPEEIGLLAFTSGFPEYTVPPQSALVHQHLKLSPKCITFDMNVCCVGALRCLDIVNRYFKDKKGQLKKAIIIGADGFSRFASLDDFVATCAFSDVGTAMLLEYDDSDSGIIGSANRTVSHTSGLSLFPACGMSSVSSTDMTAIAMSPPPTIDASNDIYITFKEISDKHNITGCNIDWYCGSQVAKGLFNKVADLCDIPQEKRIFIGDKYGYTGTSSPILALYDGFNSGKVKHGDLVLLSTYGLGVSATSVLMKI